LKHSKPIIEGDFIEDKNNLIFDVKGLVHPPDRIIAYLRYYPDVRGDRTRINGKKYTKVYSLKDREAYLSKNFPEYLYFDPVFGVKLEGVHRNQIAKVHSPVEKLQELLSAGPSNELQEKAILFAETLQSILVDLAKKDSDIDIIVYGEKNCRRAYEALGTILRENPFIKAYNEQGLRRLYEFRAKDTLMSYEDFQFSERRKHMSGEIGGVDFFVRFLKEPNEIGEKYGDARYVSLSSATIEGVTLDDRESIFTPCKYVVEHTKTLEGEAPRITEIVSFRGRFCDQIRKGERFIARGKIERVITKNRTYHRLLLGGKKTDFLIVKRV